MAVDCEAEVLKKFVDVTEFERWEHADVLAKVYMTLLSLYFAVPMALMWVRRDLFPVNLRPVLYVQVIAIGVMQLAATTIGRETIPFEDFPCDALLWSRTLLVPLIFGPHLLIMQNLLSRVELSLAMQAFRVGEEELHLDELLSKVRATGWRRQLRLISVVLLPALVLIGVGYRAPYYGNGCTGCDRDLEQEIIIGVFALLAFTGGLLLNRQLRRHEDPLGLRREVDVISYVTLVCAGVYFVFGLVKPLNDAAVRGEFNSIWWLLVIGMYMHFVYCVRPLWRSYKQQNKQVQQQQQVRRRTQLARKKATKKSNKSSKPIDKGSSQEASQQEPSNDGRTGTGTANVSGDGDMTLAQVLDIPQGVMLFQHYLASEFAVEAILFWKSAREWRRVYPEMPSVTARNAVAMNIFLAFVPDGAPMQINLASANRDRLQASFSFSRSMSTFSAPTQQTVFDEAIAEMFRLMETDSFQRFRETKAFKTFNAESQA